MKQSHIKLIDPRLLLISILSLLTISAIGQTKAIDIYDLPIPKNLDKCFSILDKTLSESEIIAVKTTPEDSICYHEEFIHKADFFHAWKLYDGSRLTKHFNKKGLVGSFEIYEAILISYQRYLNQIPIDLDGQIKKYQEIQRKEYEEYLEQFDKDTIDGIYIPINMEDCFNSLNLLLSKADIDTIKSLPNREETIMYHHSLGMWIRNNWGLWKGSRLQRYFINRKITHPDSMSSTILEFYYDWLNGKNEDWFEFEANSKR